MFAFLLSKLCEEVNAVKAAVATHDVIRRRLYIRAEPENHGTGAPDPVLGEIIASAPGLTDWRVYDHCAAFTRLYALYEGFVGALVSEWLRQLPALYATYADLPEPIRRRHRCGVGDILTKLGGAQYEHLDDLKVIHGLAAGVSGITPYELLADAFLARDTNLWHNALQKLLSGAGVCGADKWIAQHGKIQKFISDVRGEASSVVSELDGFVRYRNMAAHGVVSDIVAVDEFARIADFVVTLCDVLAELVFKRIVDRCLQIGQFAEIGVVIHRFSNNIVGVKTEDSTFEEGDALVAIRNLLCISVRVESLEIEGTPHEKVSAKKGSEVGMKLDKSVKEGSRLIRLMTASRPAT